MRGTHIHDHASGKEAVLGHTPIPFGEAEEANQRLAKTHMDSMIPPLERVLDESNEVDANDLGTHDLLEASMDSGIGHLQTDLLLAPLLLE